MGHPSLKGPLYISEAFPGDTTTKLKHTYIYSRDPNYGKTYNMHQFSKEYNAHFIGDYNNWLSVPKKTQFLLCEEYSPKNCIPYDKLKAMTSGTADGVTGNVKTHGESWEPREDVQFVMISNTSLYEVYGEWCPKQNRRFITPERVKTLESRFNIVRLDGDVQEDKRKALGPQNWSEDVFRAHLRKKLVVMCGNDKLNVFGKNLADLTSVRRVLTEAGDMYMTRNKHSDEVINSRTFGEYLNQKVYPTEIQYYGSIVAAVLQCGFNDEIKPITGVAWTKAKESVMEEYDTRIDLCGLAQHTPLDVAEWVQLNPELLSELYSLHYAHLGRNDTLEDYLAVHPKTELTRDYEQAVYKPLIQLLQKKRKR